MKNIRLLFLVLMIHQGIGLSAFAQDMKSGPLTLEIVNKRFFLTVADSLLNREIVVLTRVVNGAAVQGRFDVRKMYAGVTLNEILVRFTTSLDGRIQLEQVNHQIRNINGLPRISRAIEGYNKFPIIAVFDKVDNGGSDDSFRIDFTDFIAAENAVLGPDPYTKKTFNMESLQVNKSGFIRYERFQSGMDIRLFRTYTSGTGSRSMVLNASFFVLPEKPMVSRVADHRVVSSTFNVVEFTDFGCNLSNAESQKIVYRYRMEPSDNDKIRYLRGELVVPKNPIIFYLDPNIPEESIPYFKKGLLMWSKAFEKAGFKQAIQVREVANSANDFNFFSARYNTVDYLPSDSYGGHADIFVDQRSGEIFNSRIRMPHSNTAYLRNKYMVLAGASDVHARKAEFSNELNGELSAVVVAHELGHCLGVHHNYLSSALVPVEKLRDKNWVEKNGISPSIMDYSRLNYIAQPEDKIAREGLIPKIGVYDLWAIEWLYRWYPVNNASEEIKLLNQLYDRRIAVEPMIAYINISWSAEDTRLKMEDVGDNAMKASFYGIKNLKYVAPHILDWTRFSNGGYNYDLALEVYQELLAQYRHFMQHVVANIGGTQVTLYESNARKITGRLSKNEQRASVDFLASELFDTPDWLISPELIAAFSNRGQNSFPSEAVFKIQTQILDKLVLDLARIIKVKKGVIADTEQYHYDELLSDLENHLFKELKKSMDITPERRMLQRSYIRKLGQMSLSLAKNEFLTDEQMVYKAHLKSVKTMATIRLSNRKDRLTELHLQQLVDDIDEVLAIVKK